MDFCTNIFDLSRKLFFQKGIKCVSIDDISKELGVSKKTFYKHIESKEVLVNQLVSNHLEKEVLDFEQIYKNSNNAIEELYTIFQYNASNCMNMNNVFIEDLQKNYYTIWKKMENHFNIEIPKSIQANIERGQKELLYRTDNINSEYIAYLYSKNVFNTLDFFMSKNNMSITDLFNFHFYYHIHGIATEKGKEILNNIILNNQKEPHKSSLNE